MSRKIKKRIKRIDSNVQLATALTVCNFLLAFLIFGMLLEKWI